MARLKVFVAAPHNLSGIQAASNGSVKLSFAGGTTPLFAPYYDLYPLETSSNLVEWAPLTTLQRTNAALDTLSFLDGDPPEVGGRFYRTPGAQLPTPDPQPTGAYPVGTISMPLTNSFRNNAKFMVTFWYPAVAPAGLLPAKYVEARVATGGGYNLTGSGGGDFGSQVAGFFSHSLSNAPLAANHTAYPVVLYDPGAGGHRRENTDKAEDLASWGYLVVGLDASDTTMSVFPSGTAVGGQAVANTVAGYDAAIEGRLLDLRFVLDELERLNAGDPRFGGRLNLDHFGAFGWSLGGATAAQLCLRDPRCHAGAGLDANYFETNLLTRPLGVPWLYFRADTGPFGEANQVFAGLVTNAYWVQLRSTVHGSFSDYDLIVDPSSLEAVWGAPTSGQLLPPARVSQIVRVYLHSFFDKFLRGKDDHLLDHPSPAYPEVMEFLSKDSAGFSPGFPRAGLAQSGDGNFYGTTYGGGAGANGTAFQMTPAGVLTTLVLFNGTNGAQPRAPLVRGRDGNFYGTTDVGGASNAGTVFSLTSSGRLTTLVSLSGAIGGIGGGSYAALAQGSDGDFYGTTWYGGDYGDGTVFKMTAAGVLTTLVSFNGANGSAPVAALVQGSDGNFYGTTEYGGDLSLFSGFGDGTVFRITTNGALTTLAVFNNATGAQPCGPLVQGNDGNFYGTTSAGPANGGYPNGWGTVFKISAAGELTTLVSFNGVNGSQPYAGLVQGGDGNFYGTTASGGASGLGTVFRVTAAGALTTLVSFDNLHGSQPYGGLTQGGDGNFYGTTEFGGANDAGTVFKMTSTGVLSSLVDFALQAGGP